MPTDATVPDQGSESAEQDSQRVAVRGRRVRLDARDDSMIGLLILAVAAGASPPSTLIIGVREKGDRLATVYVDASRIERLGEGLAVERGDGWWTLTMVEHRTLDLRELA